MTRVFDASIGSRGLIQSQLLPEAEHLLGWGGEVVVPTLFMQETLSAIFKAERRGNVSSESADEARIRLGGLRHESLEPARFLDRAYEIALRFRQSDIYDAVYLVCADDVGAELWTCDRKFVASFGRQRPANPKLCPDDV